MYIINYVKSLNGSNVRIKMQKNNLNFVFDFIAIHSCLHLKILFILRFHISFHSPFSFKFISKNIICKEFDLRSKEMVFNIKPICHYYDSTFEDAFQIKLHDLETIHLRTYKFSKDDCWDTPLNFPNGIVDGIRKIKRLKCVQKSFTTCRLFSRHSIQMKINSRSL